MLNCTIYIYIYMILYNAWYGKNNNKKKKTLKVVSKLCICIAFPAYYPGADPEVFQRGEGGGVEKEHFERKMIVDTRIIACTHKN